MTYKSRTYHSERNQVYNAFCIWNYTYNYTILLKTSVQVAKKKRTKLKLIKSKKRLFAECVKQKYRA